MQYKGDPTLALVGCFLRDGRKILGRERIGGARATYYFLLDFFFSLKCHIGKWLCYCDIGIGPIFKGAPQKKKDTNMFFSLSLIELPIAKVVYLYGEDKLKQDN